MRLESARLIATLAHQQKMTLGPGRRLGRYEIRAKIGEGGMGEVYQARDIQLDRQVALKLLPADVARDQQRLHRFLQEARAASALSHPNVAHIYEIGEAEDAHFIAMEYVEGTPLDKKIGAQPLVIGELLDIAIQIADALDEAHAKGIIHRDIKSANVMITARGRVKVLDFGLAKLATPTGVTDRTSESEIATRVKTSPGMVMGTVNYMSPEQAMGREVDRRSDIFSFGVVLYEMATGRLPFTGDTVTATIDRITHAQPEALARLNYNVPPELDVIVKKALRKDREERYQTIHDVLIDLKELRRELDLATGLERSTPPPARSSSSESVSHHSTTGATSVPPAPQTVSVLPAHPTSSAEYIVGEIKRHRIGIGVIAAVVLLAVAGVGLYKFVTSRNQTQTKPPGVGVSSNMKIKRLTMSGRALEGAISPDGKWVVYVQKDGSQQSLWIYQIATNRNIPIVPPADVQIGRETFSPDGNYVYYLMADANNPAGVLYQASTIGGPPRKILANLESPITFSPDGSRIAFTRNDEVASGEDQLIVANADGTDQRKLAARKPKDQEWFINEGCGWSPDGKVIACPGGRHKNALDNFVIAVDPETGEQKELTSAELRLMGRVSWLADGSGIMVNAAERESYFSQVWFISYPGGEAHKITNEDLIDYYGTSLTTDSTSLVTVGFDSTANIWSAPTGEMAHAKQITRGKYEGYGSLGWTPDGRIVYESFSSGNPDIWIMNSDGSGQKQLTTDPAADHNPAVSPDGRYIVFESSRRGPPNLWRMDLDGSNVKQLTDQLDLLPHISPDGKWVIFDSWRSGKRGLWKVSIDGGQPVQITDKSTRGAGISPDGKLIACYYRDEERPGWPWRIMILPFEGGQPLKTFAASVTDYQLDGAVGWTPDGRAITYVDSTGGTPNLWSQPLDGGPPKKLTDFKENGVFRYAWTRDGKQLALTRGTFTSDVVLISDFR